MQTNFSASQLKQPAIGYSDVELRACLQCGYCTDICPTYQELGDELDSPRGRIRLIRDMLESGKRPEKQTVTHIDRCLSCFACMSSCPSSVNYMHLVDHAREHIHKNYRRTLMDRFMRWSLANILPFPDRFRLATRAAQWAKPLAAIMPVKIRHLINLAPQKLPPPSSNDQPQIFYPTNPTNKGKNKRRIALLTGCVQQALDTDINDATIRLLQRHGCEVVIAQGTGCCGALNHHIGKTDQSRAAAANNIGAWMREFDTNGLAAVVVNTSGCGTVIKDYAHMFKDDPLAQDAATISSLAKDISEILADIELNFKLTPDLRVAYHATCSLQFGQRIRFTPKKLLKRAGFRVLEPRESHLCCGSAGTYSLLQPEISGLLKERKVTALEGVAPDAIAAGNIGCMVQISSGTKIPVVHTVQLLDWATGGPKPPILQHLPDKLIAAQ